MKGELKYKLLIISGPFIGFGISLLLLGFIAFLMKENPINVYKAMAKFSFSKAGIAYILADSTPLIFSGLAVAVAFQAGVFNIGVEGQYFIGALVGAVIGIYLKLPAIIHLPLVILFCMIGGALWALFPALLKVIKGVHEVISTIMMNMVGYTVALFLVNGPLSGLQKGISLEPRTKEILPTAVLKPIHGLFSAVGIDFPKYVALDFSFIIAIGLCVVMWFFLYQTRYGFNLRAVGINPDAAEYSGIKTKRVVFWSFLLSGAIGGLVGLHEVFYIRKYYTFNIAHGVGFDGIAVALIGSNNPFGVIPAAFLLSGLKRAGYGLQLFTSLPNSVITAITGAMILLIVISNTVVLRIVRKMRKKEVGGV